MMRSLYSGVAGLRTHQLRMDVIGNNIANVNTIGYKKSRTVFQDMMSQTLRGASQPTANVGGMNPVQVGLGVSLGTIDVLHTQGAAMSTGNNFDLMIQGDGYFVVADAKRDAAGNIDWNDSYDEGTVAYTRAGNFAFDEQGFLVCTSTGKYILSYVPDETDPTAEGTLSLVQVPISNVRNVSVDAQGYITFIDPQGNIGSFSPDNDYTTDPIDYGIASPIAVAKFNNPMGLEKIGMNMYNRTNNSGVPFYDGPNGRHGQGSLLPGNLEMSNVDLAEEFTDMIVTQRGHQANARTIRTSDEMLQELAQIKR
ncbi:flagellar hook-basal body complex protein [Desulfitibacter alkalitolerans]|uniref:flagellar hook-basal body complex protein n=1 Tax=Desulfitibacter alkalitolerans TaxID=264641 RepID=UPI00047FD893|nr:flagellar hook-basal body complex protein [Desulfitibacter alkalitolerans]